MEIITVKDTHCDENCYIIKNGAEGILIDPGEDTLKILKNIEGINIKYILLTHCHYDHIYSLKKLKGSKIVCGSSFLKSNITNPKIILEDLEIKTDAIIDEIFEDGEVKNLCGINIKCIYTPGHTDCSVCYLAENCLFSGDTLFLGTVGRWDLPTGNFDALQNSIKNKLYLLNNDTVVFPGHGGQTTIAFEKKNGLFKEEK